MQAKMPQARLMAPAAVPAQQMYAGDAETMPEDESYDAEPQEEIEGEEYGDEAVEVGEQFVEEGGAPEDMMAYSDYDSPGGGAPSPSYYGGGGGGGGGGYQYPQPAATVAPATNVCPDGAAPTGYNPTTGAPICGTVTPAPTPTPVVPAGTPKAVSDFMKKAADGRVRRGDVVKAADAAQKAGMPNVASQIVKVGNRVMSTAPESGRGGRPGPVAPAPPSPPSGGKPSGSRGTVQPRQSSRKPTTSRRVLRGFEDLEENMSPTFISEATFGDLGAEEDEFLYGGGEDVYGESAFAPEGQIPGYEMSDEGDYMEPAMEEPGYGPAPSSYDPYAASQYAPQSYMPSPYGMPQMPYGYQQQMPYGMPQMPYGMDPYAQQGYPQYGYDPYAAQGQQPTGYDPVTGQPIYGGTAGGCPDGSMPTGYNPQTGQPVCGAAAGGASLFPAGTPQVIIDCATAIMNGTATLELVQSAVSTATSMGYAAVANQLIAMYQQYGGQYTPGTSAGGGRYCAAGEDPTVTGCVPKTTGTVPGTVSFGPMPTDAAGCAAEATRLMTDAKTKAIITAAFAAQKAKKTLTQEQRVYMIRYTNLKRCIASKGGPVSRAGVTGTKTTLTDAEKAAGCHLTGRAGSENVWCPGPGQSGPKLTLRQLARNTYLYVVKAFNASRTKGSWSKNWDKMYVKAANLPTTPASSECVASVNTALRAARAAIPTGNFQSQLTALTNAMKKCNIYVSA